MSRSGVILLFEGLANTVVDAQVLLHARDMRRQGIAEFEVWAVACSARAHARSLELREAAVTRAAGPVRVFRGVAPTLPGSARANARRLAPVLRRHGPLELVHARTDYAAEVVSHLREVASFELIWDCRGDVEAEARFRHAGASPWRVALRTWQCVGARRRVRAARAECDRAIFVTHALRERLVASDLDGRSEVIPGSGDSELFFFSPELRARTREELGWPESAPILVYSGSLAEYQCWEESLTLFQRLRRKTPELRLLVVTPSLEAARASLAGLPEDAFRVRSAPIEGVNAFLNAADAGLLLLRDDPRNSVCFPVKLSEYGLAGLPVLMTTAAPEAAALAQEIGNALPLDLAAIPKPAGEARTRVSEAFRERLCRAAQRDAYRRVYASLS